MFPSRLSRIFRSRWAALLWAAGVLWMAVEVAGFGTGAGNAKQADTDNASTLTDATGTPVSDADLAALKNIIEQAK